jgi:hypothetical protein
MVTAASPLFAAQPEMTGQTGAPPAPPSAEYCLRVDPPTGSRIETIRCETREGWAQLDVNLDEEWAKWGVRIIPSRAMNS